MEYQQFLVFFVLLGFVLKVNCKDACELSLQKDFGVPTPVFLYDNRFLPPGAAKRLRVTKGDSLTAACPGDRRHVVLGNHSTQLQDVEATCVSNTTFEVGAWRGEFKDIKCNSQPWFGAEDEDSCYQGNRLYKIGYKIRNVFHKLYEACFDHNVVTTLYVKHLLTTASKYSQGGRRPQFIEGGLYGDVRMSELYKTKNQRNKFEKLLGAHMDDEYFTKNQFLTRGHLAPRGDFAMSALQRATFHYVNTAPQWMRMNAGDWAAVEDALRRRVQKLNSSLTIYTGTYDVLSLDNSDGRPTDIYLATDANNNGIVPVPMYFYKLVYNPTDKTAIAFVTINSSFYNNSKTDALTFCCDVCEDNSNYSWLRWRNDGSHSFCCGYEEFVKKVKHLPKIDVKGLFF